jgi:hypothetical protein
MSKPKMALVATVLLAELLPNRARAWDGDTWGPMSRAEGKSCRMTFPPRLTIIPIA